MYTYVCDDRAQHSFGVARSFVIGVLHALMSGDPPSKSARAACYSVSERALSAFVITRLIGSDGKDHKQSVLI
jgi:hypothetical protein